MNWNKRKDLLRLSMNRIVILLVSLFYFQNTFGQDKIFSQYFVNPSLMNPAVMGTAGNTNITFGHRNQWLNVEGRPLTTYIAYYDTFNKVNLPKHKKPKPFSSVGGIIFNDKRGLLNEFIISGVYAYNLPVTWRYRLSFGGRLEASYYDIDTKKLQNGVNDRSLAALNNTISLNTSFGLWWYSDQLFLGLSATEVNSSEQFSASYYSYFGYLIELSKIWEYVPSLLIRFNKNSATQLELNSKFRYDKDITFGSSVRSNYLGRIHTMVFIIGWTKRNYHITYSYDTPLSVKDNIRADSHELTFSIDLNYLENKKICYTFW